MSTDHMTREQLTDRVAELEAQLLEREHAPHLKKISRDRYAFLLSKLIDGASIYGEPRGSNHYTMQECSDIHYELLGYPYISRYADNRVQRVEEDYEQVWNMLQSHDIKATLLEDWKRQRTQIRELKRQITIACEGNHANNVMLDALHLVWCDGGCATGVHRYDDLGPDGITQEIVDAATRNTDRLKQWWHNRQQRLEREKAKA